MPALELSRQSLTSIDFQTKGVVSMCITIVGRIFLIGGLLLVAMAPASQIDQGLMVAPPPNGTILAATIVRGADWYAMGGKEIQCLNKILARKLSFYTKGIEVNPPRDYSIVIWRIENAKLVPADEMLCGQQVTALISTAEAGYFDLEGVEERGPLLELMTRIKKGLEQPIAVRKEIGAVTGSKEKAKGDK